MRSFAVGVAAAVILGLLVWLYGVEQHAKGYQKRGIEAELEAALLLTQARDKEHQLLDELDHAYQEAYAQKQLADTTIADLRTDRDRLRGIIATQSQRATSTQSATGVDAVSAAAWVALDECVSSYAAVAGTADGYVEDLRKGQAWAKAISSN